MRRTIKGIYRGLKSGDLASYGVVLQLVEIVLLVSLVAAQACS